MRVTQVKNCKPNFDVKAKSERASRRKINGDTSIGIEEWPSSCEAPDAKQSKPTKNQPVNTFLKKHKRSRRTPLKARGEKRTHQVNSTSYLVDKKINDLNSPEFSSCPEKDLSTNDCEIDYTTGKISSAQDVEVADANDDVLSQYSSMTENSQEPTLWLSSQDRQSNPIPTEVFNDNLSTCQERQNTFEDEEDLLTMVSPLTPRGEPGFFEEKSSKEANLLDCVVNEVCETNSTENKPLSPQCFSECAESSSTLDLHERLTTNSIEASESQCVGSQIKYSNLTKIPKRISRSKSVSVEESEMKRQLTLLDLQDVLENDDADNLSSQKAVAHIQSRECKGKWKRMKGDTSKVSKQKRRKLHEHVEGVALIEQQKPDAADNLTLFQENVVLLDSFQEMPRMDEKSNYDILNIAEKEILLEHQTQNGSTLSQNSSGDTETSRVMKSPVKLEEDSDEKKALGSDNIASVMLLPNALESNGGSFCPENSSIVSEELNCNAQTSSFNKLKEMKVSKRSKRSRQSKEFQESRYTFSQTVQSKKKSGATPEILPVLTWNNLIDSPISVVAWQHCNGLKKRPLPEFQRVSNPCVKSGHSDFLQSLFEKYFTTDRHEKNEGSIKKKENDFESTLSVLMEHLNEIYKGKFNLPMSRLSCRTQPPRLSCYSFLIKMAPICNLPEPSDSQILTSVLNERLVSQGFRQVNVLYRSSSPPCLSETASLWIASQSHLTAVQNPSCSLLYSSHTFLMLPQRLCEETLWRDVRYQVLLEFPTPFKSLSLLQVMVNSSFFFRVFPHLWRTKRLPSFFSQFFQQHNLPHVVLCNKMTSEISIKSFPSPFYVNLMSNYSLRGVEGKLVLRLQLSLTKVIYVTIPTIELHMVEPFHNTEHGKTQQSVASVLTSRISLSSIPVKSEESLLIKKKETLLDKLIRQDKKFSLKYVG